LILTNPTQQVLTYLIISCTSNSNTNPEMILDVRQINNEDFSTLTIPAFRFTRELDKRDCDTSAKKGEDG